LLDASGGSGHGYAEASAIIGIAVDDERVRWQVHGERLLYKTPWVELALADAEIPAGNVSSTMSFECRVRRSQLCSTMTNAFSCTGVTGS